MVPDRRVAHGAGTIRIAQYPFMNFCQIAKHVCLCSSVEEQKEGQVV